MKVKVKQNQYVLRKNNNKNYVKLISTIVVYLSLIAILYIPFQRSIRNIELSPFAITTVIWRDLASVIMIYFAFLYDKHFRRLLMGKTSIIYFIFILFYICIGFIYRNALGRIRLDLESGLALVAGIAMFVLVTKSYRPKMQLISIIAISTCLVCYGTLLITINQGIVFGDLGIRAVDAKIYQYFHFPIILSALAFAVFLRQNYVWKILICSFFALNIYFVGFLGASRTPFLEMFIVLFSSIFGLCYTVSNGFLTTKFSTLSTRRLFPILIFLGVIILSFVFFEFADFIIDFIQNSLIYQRAFGGAAEYSTNSRIEEVTVFLRDLNDFEWLLGKGLGGDFKSPIFPDGNIWFLHIGIFTTWLKGGILLFSFFIFTFYIKFPILFFQAVLIPKKFKSGKRTALLTILPGVFGYVVLMSTTGGFQFEHVIPLGFMFGAYLHIRNYGLGIFV